MELRAVRVICAAVMLLAALTLKLSYSRAGVSELLWVLGPSCALAKLGGVQLSYEAGAGFISHRSHMVVGVACAGVNFLVASWLALYFSLEPRYNSLRTKLLCVVGSLFAAYLASVTANGLRIMLAAHLYEWPVYAGGWTPARAHRVLGIVLYCTVLLVLCSVAERGASRRCGSSALLWYTGVVVALPLANRGLSRLSSAAMESSSSGGLLLEHALVTLGTAAGVFAAFRATVCMAAVLRRRVWRGRPERVA